MHKHIYKAGWDEGSRRYLNQVKEQHESRSQAAKHLSGKPNRPNGTIAAAASTAAFAMCHLCDEKKEPKAS